MKLFEIVCTQIFEYKHSNFEKFQPELNMLKTMNNHDLFSFYRQCNLSRKFNCKARVTTTDTGEIIVTNNEHCHTEIRQHLKKDYKNKLMLNALSHFNHHLHTSALSGNGPTESSNINNNNNENTRARSSSPQISSNGSWNLKKESN